MTRKLMLNIGCGRRKLPGFVNIDVIRGADLRHDVRTGIPQGDGTVDVVYSEHFLEHLTQQDGLRFLRECRRVLKPGGVVRIAMPDLDELVERYCREDWRGGGDMFKLGFEWVDNRCEMLNIAMREWGHRWVYNEEELRRVADLAGLIGGVRAEWGASAVPELADLEYRPGSKLILEFSTRSPVPASDCPKVSILIPAYRAEFLAEAIESALGQNYRNLELVVCDDCPSNAVEDIVRVYERADPRVRYHRNDPPQGPLGNYAQCFQQASGAYIQFLNDDDVLGKAWVNEATTVLSQRPDVTLVACARELIDASGARIGNAGGVGATDLSRTFEGRSVAGFLATLGVNRIGEPSACMFRRSDVEAIRPHVMTIAGGAVRGLGDLSLWLTLLSKGDLVYLSSSRCMIRQHENQWKKDPRHAELVVGSWTRLRKHAARLGLYGGILGYHAVPNPLRLFAGYKWRTLEARDGWRTGRVRPAQLAVFGYKMAKLFAEAVVKRPWRRTRPTDTAPCDEAGRSER